MSSHQVDILLISICNTEKPRRGRSLSTTDSHIMFSVTCTCTCTCTFTTTSLTPRVLSARPLSPLLHARFAVPHLPPELGQRALAAILWELGMMMICRERKMCSLAKGAVPPLSKGEKSVFKMLYPWKIN